MNVLSLFDGMGCGRLALEKLNIYIDNYFASEIDKWAKGVAEYNFPDIIPLGDINGINCQALPHIDLLIGGSPCQGFSIAGNRLNFADPRSKLFFKFVEILKATRPKYFMLENVVMKQEWKNVISEYLQIKPVMLDSALVSAQSRKRLYWTNIPIEPLIDKGIFLRDVIESGTVDREKSYCIDHNYWKGGSQKYLENTYKNFGKRQVVSELPQSTRRLMVRGGNLEPKVAIDDVHYRKLTPLECERLQTVPEGYTKYWITADNEIKETSNTQRYKMLGNGWTVDVIAHIFKKLKEEYGI